MTADGWFDLSSVLSIGKNVVHIRHLRPLNDYYFVVRGNKPTSAQLVEVHALQVKEAEALAWATPSGETFREILTRLATAQKLIF